MTTINQLPPATNPQPTDLIPVQTANGTTAAYTPTNISAAMGIGQAAYLKVGGANGAVVADNQGNLSPQSFVSQGTTAARTFAVRGADHTNVADYGAKLDGVTNDIGAFTAAYNAVGNAGIIDIPAGGLWVGTFNGDVNKSVLWRAMGNLDYGSYPAGTNTVSYIPGCDGDVFEGFVAGRKILYKEIHQSAVGTDGVLECNVQNFGSLPSAVITITGTNSQPSGYINAVMCTVQGTSDGGGGGISFFANAINPVGATARSSCYYGQTMDYAGLGGGCMEIDFFSAIPTDPISGDPIDTSQGVALFQAESISNNSGTYAPGAPANTQVGRIITTIAANGCSAGVHYFAKGPTYSAVFDATSVVPLSSDVAGLRLPSGLGIDFSASIEGNVKNKRVLVWNPETENLEYQLAGTAVFSIADNGNISSVNSITLENPATQGNQVPQLKQIDEAYGFLLNGLTQPAQSASDCYQAPVGCSVYVPGTQNNPGGYGVLNRFGGGNPDATGKGSWDTLIAYDTSDPIPLICSNINGTGWSPWYKLASQQWITENFQPKT